MNGRNLKARAALALRAERAFGLNMLAVDALPIDAAPVAQPPPPAPVRPPPSPQRQAATPPPLTPRPAPVAAAPRATNLFGVSKQSPNLIELPAFSAPPLSSSQKVAQLKLLNENEVSICRKCVLCETRTNTVFGEGDADAKVMFIGEGPGETEDLQGRPFVGRAGNMLNQWISAMGLTREQVFIANIVKCRPPGNREPAPDETASCTPYLLRQIEIIRPDVLITLGKPSSQYMLQTKNSMGSMRGQWHVWRGIKLLPTYHPAYVLRNYTRQTRSAVWDDLQKVMSHLGLPIPKRAATE